MEISSIATLSGIAAPSEARREAAKRMAVEVLASLENRDDIIEKRGLDAKFGKPDANWADDSPNDFRDAVKLLATLEWTHISNLRLMAQCFTGYSLREMKGARGVRSVGEISSDFDDRLRQIDPTEVIRSWQDSVKDVPEWARVKPPHILGEIGWYVDGVLVNYDTRVYQERMTLLYSSGVLDKLRSLGRPARILEIGGGYGALALALMEAVPDCEYVICDLPESLLFSGIYLSIATQNVKMHGGAGNERLSLLPNYLFDTLSENFDLVINTLSMSEMSEYQVKRYASGIRNQISDHGIFFEQNQNNIVMGLSFAEALLAPEFPARQQMQSRMVLTEGSPNLWANSQQVLDGLQRPTAQAPAVKAAAIAPPVEAPPSPAVTPPASWMTRIKAGIKRRLASAPSR
ncbi:putative sugar O-methyltransferase [Pseudomonas asplenii]|uniref:putative sugar O-methyltransferase n=1 Tax=Pseudomonas asplenii TaxID=53407 RepID=UPI00128FAD72|nr:putative sugar O-methyltransferase [Pseudomonas fuscovaginae]